MIKYFDRREVQARENPIPWYWGYAWRRITHDQIIMILIPFNVPARWCYQFVNWLRYPPGSKRDSLEDRTCLHEVRDGLRKREHIIARHSKQIAELVELNTKLADLFSSHIRETHLQLTNLIEEHIRETHLQLTNLIEEHIRESS